jgi:hypothetical protein
MPSSFATCATDRRRARARATTHAAVMNSMSHPFDHLDDAIAIFHRGLAADFGIGAGAETLGDVAADLQAGLHLRVLSACASVLMHMNSTPSMPLVTMCATALPPPPPTPITLITAFWL